MFAVVTTSRATDCILANQAYIPLKNSQKDDRYVDRTSLTYTEHSPLVIFEPRTTKSSTEDFLGHYQFHLFLLEWRQRDTSGR